MTALGNFTAGDVLTAADLNVIGTWTSYTPNVRATSGTFTTVAVYDAKYTQINQLLIGYLFFKITSVGTGAGAVRFDLPVSTTLVPGSTTDGGIGGGRENQLTGNTLNVIGHVTYADIVEYDNTTMIANNAGAGVFFMYRTA